jgi:hypothetical protein
MIYCDTDPSSPRTAAQWTDLRISGHSGCSAPWRTDCSNITSRQLRQLAPCGCRRIFTAMSGSVASVSLYPSNTWPSSWANAARGRSPGTRLAHRAAAAPEAADLRALGALGPAWQIFARPHSLQLLLMRWCWQMLRPGSLYSIIEYEVEYEYSYLLLLLLLPGAPAVLAPAPDAVMLADAGAPAVLALAPLAVVLALLAPPSLCHAGTRRGQASSSSSSRRRRRRRRSDARPPAFFAPALFVLVRTQAALACRPPAARLHLLVPAEIPKATMATP